MSLMTNISMLMTLVITILMIMTMYLSKNSFQDREKNSPFECGFDRKSSAPMPFSLQFFLILMIPNHYYIFNFWCWNYQLLLLSLPLPMITINHNY